MGKMSRTKGKVGERASATELREALPELAGQIRRGWQSREGDDDPDITGIPEFWHENKRGKKPNIRAALEQAIADSKGRGIPVAIIRDDRADPIMAMRFADYLKLLRAFLKQAGYLDAPRAG